MFCVFVIIVHADGKNNIYDFWQEPHTAKEKADYLKNAYGSGGGNAAFSHNFFADENHSSKGMRLRKPDCGDVLMTWTQVVKRLDKLIAQDRYLTAEEKARRNTVIEEPKEPEISPETAEYNRIRELYPDDLVLFQRGDFYVLYGEDARAASELGQLTLTTREVSDSGHIEMAGFPVHALEQYSEVLRDKYDLAIASTVEGGIHEVRRVLSVDHEAAQAIDAHEAEFGADGSRAFGPVIPERPPTEEDITAAIQAWNGDVASKRKVVRYMREHDRERGTAQWLRDEFGGNLDAFPIRLTGMEQTEIPWRDVQRRMITLLKNDRFFTEQELDNFDDIDPIEIRERLAEAGIVNGEVVDPDALDNDPFIRQVMADAERFAQEEQAAEPSPPQAPAEPKKRPGQTRVERNYRAFTQMFPEIVSGEYRYLELRNREDGGLMPLIIQQIGENEIAMSHTYEQYGDLMYDPEMTFRIDTENGTLEPLTFRQDGGFPIYQEVYPEPGKWIPRLRNDLSAFTDQWLKNIEMQGRIRTRAIAEINGEDVEFTFDEHGNPVRSERTEQNIQDGQFTEITPTDTPAEPYTESITLADGTTYSVGDTVTIQGTDFKITDIGPFDVQLLDPTLLYPVFRSESHESFERLMGEEKAQTAPTVREETTAFYPGEKTNLPYDIEIRTLHIDEPEHTPPPTAENYRILDTHLGEGGAKEKFWRNTKAIATLKQIESENRQATPEEQYILSQYVGWGGLPDAFDPDKSAWAAEYSELKDLLTDEEYSAARASTLNAHYTTPTVIQAIYDAVGNMGFRTGNILEPAMGVGNFFGMLPEEMRGSRLYGVELDSISGRIAKQLYPQANITVAGFETTDRKDFFDLAVGNVPFGNYQVNDRAYNKLGFSIHNYFFATAEQCFQGKCRHGSCDGHTLPAKAGTADTY